MRAIDRIARRREGEIRKNIATALIKEERITDYFEVMDLETKGLSPSQRIDKIFQYSHSEEVKSQLHDVDAFRFHNQQNALIQKHDYRILTGRMCTFWYAPENPDQMRIYDRYPLVVIVKRKPDGFTGINFHYLGMRERAELLTHLRDRIAFIHDPEKTALKIKYGELASRRKYKYFRPAIKDYKKKNIKSRFILIPEKNWDKALVLPIEDFRGTIPSRVLWKESKREAIKLAAGR